MFMSRYKLSSDCALIKHFKIIRKEKKKKYIAKSKKIYTFAKHMSDLTYILIEYNKERNIFSKEFIFFVNQATFI